MNTFRPIVAGTTDVSVIVTILDATTGVPREDIVYNSSGIDLEYRRDGAAAVDITEVSLANAAAAHADGGFVHISKGSYRVDLPDAACASGVNGVWVGGAVTGCVVVPCYIPLWAANPYDSVRMGMTALPNAAAEAAGGLYTRGSGAGQIAQAANGQINANTVTIEGSDATDQINAACDAAIETYHLDHLLAVAYDPASKPGAADALLNELVESDAGVARFTANALEQAPTGGGSGGLITSGTAAGIAAGTITLASGHGITDTSVIVVLTGGTNADGKARLAVYSGTGDVFNVTPAWNATVNGNAETTPSGTITYEVYPYAPPSDTYVPEVDVVQIGGDAQSAADLKDFVDAGYDPSTNKVQGVVLTDTVTTYTGNTPQTGDAFARLGAPAGASVSADIAAIEAQTDDIGTAGAGLTNIPWNASWDAEVQSEVADALAAYDGPTNAEMEARTIVAANYATAANLATVDGIVDALLVIANKLDTMLELDGAVYRYTVNALEQAPAGGGGGSTDWTADERDVIRAVLGIPGSGTTPADPTTGILDTIRDLIVTVDTVVDRIEVDTQDLQTQVGTDGAGLTALPWNAAWDAEVQSEVTDALVAYDPPTNAEMEARTLVAANYATAANLATVDTVVDAILVDTAEIGTAGAGLTALASAANLATVDTVVDAIKAKTDQLTFTEAGHVDANTRAINDTPLTGDGQPGTEFDVA